MGYGNSAFITADRTTGTSGAINISVDAKSMMVVHEVRIHLSAGGAASNLTITINSGSGAVYDTNLNTQAMSGLTDYVYQPDNPHILFNGDTLDIDYANSGNATYGVEVVYEVI